MICGIDEAGRGPLAGPVCAAAVILGDNFPKGFLDDSKAMSSSSRETGRHLILSRSIAWGIGWASPSEIDRLNILRGSLLAMKRAFESMMAKNTFLPSSFEVIVDGLYVPEISMPSRPLVKADAQIPEVMAASILAKTARDRMMEFYSVFYPEYGYEKHKGYPTKAHRSAITQYGPSPIQRLSFNVKVLKKAKD